jgi:hypothetical protein
MPLPHFTNIQSHTATWEPVYQNLFEVTVILPSLLTNKHPNAPQLLLENATSVTLPNYPPLGTTTEQRFKYSTRLYMGTPESTSLQDINVTFNLNQNDNLQVMNWRIIKDWYDLGWNNETGELNYKKNLVGSLIVNIHDRNGFVIRRVVYHNTMCKSISGWGDLNWTSNTTIQALTAGFAVDYWEDNYY